MTTLVDLEGSEFGKDFHPGDGASRTVNVWVVERNQSQIYRFVMPRSRGLSIGFLSFKHGF